MGGKIGLDTYCGQSKALCVKDLHLLGFICCAVYFKYI